MKVYEYGEGNPRTLLMLQCTAEPTWVFERPARCLARGFHVFLAAAPGHDPTEDTTFTTIEDYATEAVAYLKQRGVTRLREKLRGSFSHPICCVDCVDLSGLLSSKPSCAESRGKGSVGIASTPNSSGCAASWTVVR